MKTLIAPTLPKPDDYGNYWFGEKNKMGPCILHSATKNDDYIVGTGKDMLWVGGKLRRFATPAEAFKALQEKFAEVKVTK